MSKQRIDVLYNEMLEQLESINGSLKEPIQHLITSLNCIYDKIELLREELNQGKFSSKEGEIEFFKFIKPKFVSWSIYVIELNNICLATPVGTDQMIRDYYLAELELVNRCFRIYAFYYQYYLKNESSNDEEYFLRVNLGPFQIGNENQKPDQAFSTQLDYLYAFFLASERLRDYIIRKLKLLHQNQEIILTEYLKSKNRIWSGDKVELIEIAYGIFYTQRINSINGAKVEIGQIIEWLEDSLHVDLSQAYRMFLDIRRRKTLSYTKYLDEMREAIQQRIEDTFRYKQKNHNKKE